MTKFSFKIALVLFVKYYWEYVLCNSEVKIVGGRNISISEAPHAVGLITNTDTYDGNHWFICGSSVLMNNVLLTAAHCIAGKILKFGFVAGQSKIHDNIKFVTKSKRVLHKDYKESNFGYDIGIIKLQEPLSLGSNIKRIAIMKNPPLAKKGNVAGWGRTQANKPVESPYLLKSTAMLIFDYEQCIKKKKRPVGTLCVSAIDSDAEFGYTAKGDSGSALVIDNFIAIGLLSTGPKYEDMVMDRGIVFTNISYYYDWIVSQVDRVVCDGGNVVRHRRGALRCIYSQK